MGKYDLTPADIQAGINRLLADAYSSSTVSSNPTLVYISAGPGSGKTAVEVYFKKKFKKTDLRDIVIAEHGKCIIKDNAWEIITKYFS